MTFKNGSFVTFIYGFMVKKIKKEEQCSSTRNMSKSGKWDLKIPVGIHNYLFTTRSDILVYLSFDMRHVEQQHTISGSLRNLLHKQPLRYRHQRLREREF